LNDRALAKWISKSVTLCLHQTTLAIVTYPTIDRGLEFQNGTRQSVRFYERCRHCDDERLTGIDFVAAVSPSTSYVLPAAAASILLICSSHCYWSESDRKLRYRFQVRRIEKARLQTLSGYPHLINYLTSKKMDFLFSIFIGNILTSSSLCFVL
jgi:hypothetical protein